jgi:hypothetical protein
VKRIITIVLAAAVAVVGAVQSPAHAVVAPGCTTAKPTFIGGTLVGSPDGRALDAHVGVSVGNRDSAGKLRILTAEGTLNPTGAVDYSYIEKLNPTVPATGTSDPEADRTWGQCVAANITEYHIEVYPKDPVDPDNPTAPQRTNKTRYGSTAHYTGAVSAGQNVQLAMRAPVNYQSGGGNTGGVQGYVTYQGRYVPREHISRVRAFPGPGSGCGIEGYSAAADSLLTLPSPDRTYYKLDYLVGGQCGATYQRYNLQVVCAVYCGATSKMFSRSVYVTKGKWPRLDVAFA